MPYTERLPEPTRRFSSPGASAVLQFGADGRWISVSASAAELLRYDVDELIGHSAEELIAPRVRDDAHTAVCSALKVSDRVTLDLALCAGDGSDIELAVRVGATPGRHGRYTVELFDGAGAQIGDRRRAQELARRAAELARSNADLERFAGVVSHDLRSSIRVIAGCAQILERRAVDSLSGEDRELIAHIVVGVGRTTALLDGIRDWSQAREFSRLAAVDCSAVLEDVLATLAADIDASGAVVRAVELPRVIGHPAALTQLFMNLISNSIKFRGDAPPRVAIEVARDDANATFSIADNGIGIASAQVRSIFEFGHRLHGADEVPGSGIGLAICKAVVERHGGTIWLDDSYRGGARFKFTLPLASTRASSESVE